MSEMIKGKCLCGNVQYEIENSFKQFLFVIASNAVKQRDLLMHQIFLVTHYSLRLLLVRKT